VLNEDSLINTAEENGVSESGSSEEEDEEN
jgi:hypothetical protein